MQCYAQFMGTQKTTRETDSLKCKSKVYYVHITSQQEPPQRSSGKRRYPALLEGII